MQRFAIACGHKRTAAAAELVLNDGGNAADAAVAAALTAMVAEPVLAGLMGGGFAMVTAEGKTELLDFFVQTPRSKTDDVDFRSVHADFGTVTQEFHIGAGAISTPGVAPGLAELHARCGRMPFRELVVPAREAARSGVQITAYQAKLGAIVAPILTASREVEALMCHDGAPLPEGADYRNPDFADVLETFAIEGPRFVSEGEVGQALVELARQGGHLTSGDLKAYLPRWRKSLLQIRNGAELFLNATPSLGGTLIALSLQLMPHDARPLQIAGAFAQTARARQQTGDDPTHLLSPALLKQLKTTLTQHPVSARGTTHISVIDGSGMGVALTLSNGEGCGMIIPGTGIQPNNMLGEEDLVPGGWHSWARDIRLASMMCPLAVRWPDGRLAMLGSGGSNRIRTALAQVLALIVDRDTNLEEAIRHPRLHVEDTRLDFEECGLADQDRSALLDAFSDASAWQERSMFFGGVHGVMRQQNGDLSACGDLRRDGVAIVT
ncbi:MAG: gamma-glutamyltransferase [Pseudomonadota bacterium]